jgi:ABC-type transport system involved in multi-copper enzyme maturation permease subunit
MRVRESWQRILAISLNTLTEVLRQRVLNVIILFGLVMVVGSFFLTDLTFQEEFKFLKDLGYAAISLTGTLVALMGAAQMIPAEIERRTLYTLLSKPVQRFEFVLGKYLGLLGLITIILGLMSLLFAGVLGLKEQTELALIPRDVKSEDRQFLVEAVLSQSRDPNLLQALVLIWAKLAVITAISLFFSTLATSTIFIVSTTLLVYFVGHLQFVARQIWLEEMGGPSLWKNLFLALISFLVPDFQAYSLIDEIVAGHPIFWSNTLEVLLYSVVYVLVGLVISSLIFEDKEL